MRSRKPLLLPAVGTSLLFLVMCGIFSVPNASRAADESSPYRKIFVPEDRVSEWPQGDWVPVTAESFQRLTQSLQHPDSDLGAGVKLREATYRAMLSNGKLVNGSLEASLNPLTTSTESEITIATQNIIWSSVQVPGINASYGTTPTESLKIDVGSGQKLTGKWSATGQHFFDQTEFRLVLMPAENTVLFLDLPRGQEIRTVGTAVPTTVVSQSKNRRTWRMQLGSRRECTFRIATSENMSNPMPLVISERLNWLLQKTNCQLAADYQFRIQDSRKQARISFELPRSLQIERLMLNGSQLQSYRIAKSPKNGNLLLTIEIPRQRSGTLYRLSVLARSVSILDRPWRVPVPILQNHISESQTVNLRFVSPVELSFFTDSGYRLNSFQGRSTAAERLQFVRYKKNPSLSLHLSDPKSIVETIALTTIANVATTIRFQAAIQFQCQKGTLNRPQLRVANDWNIGEIRVYSPLTGEAIPFDWRTLDINGQRELELQLRNPVGVGEKILVVTDCYRYRNSLGAVEKTQPIVPMNTTNLGQYVQLVGLAQPPLAENSESPWTPIDSETPLGQLEQWEAPSGMKLFRDNAKRLKYIGAGPAKPIQFVSPQVSDDRNAVVSCIVQDDSIIERFAFRFDGTRNERHFWLSRDDLTKETLRVLSRNVNVMPVDRTALTEQQRQLCPPEGSCWRVVPTAIGPEDFVLELETIQPRLRKFQSTMAVNITAGSTNGRLEIHNASDSPVTIEGAHLGQVDSDRTDQQFWAFTFEEEAYGVTIRSQQTESDTVKLNTTAECTLLSRLAFASGQPDSHVATYKFTSIGESRRILINNADELDIESLDIDGVGILIPDTDSAELQFSLPHSSGQNPSELTIVYRTKARSLLTSSEHIIPVPKLNFDVHHFTWSVEGPNVSQFEIVKAFNKFSKNHRVVKWPTWTTCLLGPLAQTHHRDDQRFNTASLTRIETSVDSQRCLNFRSNSAVSQFYVRTTTSQWRKWFAVFIFVSVFGLQWVINRSPSVIHVRIVLLIAAVLFCVARNVDELYAEFLGSIVAASLLALLLRLVWNFSLRSVLARMSNLISPQNELKNAATMLVFLFSIAASTVIANQSVEDTPKPFSVGDVLVPYKERANMESLPPVLFVEKAKIEELRRRYTASRNGASSFWIRTAEYTPIIDAQKGVAVKATYRTSIKLSELPYRMQLPLNDVTFPGAESCQVNGENGELVSNGPGKGVFIELPSDPVPTNKVDSSDNNQPDFSETIANVRKNFTVEITYFPKPVLEGQSPKYEFKVPPVHFAKLIGTPNHSNYQIINLSGTSDGIGESQSENSWLGPISEVSFRVLPRTTETEVTNENQPAKTPLVRLASMVSADENRTVVETSFLVENSLESKLNSLAFALPRQASVEDVSGERLSAYRISYTSKGLPILVLEFTNGNKVPMTANVAITTSGWTGKPGFQSTVPLLKPVSPNTATSIRSEHLVAIRNHSSLQLDIDFDATMALSHTPVTAEEFLAAWRQEGDASMIDSAWQVHQNSPFVIRFSKRANRNLLNVSYETSVQPTTLEIESIFNIVENEDDTRLLHLNWDRRFKIQSVFSERDGIAQELTWHTFRNKLVLVFERPVSELQTVYIKAEMSRSNRPVETTKVNLPYLTDSFITESSSLIIRNSTDHPVQVDTAKEWELVSAEPTFSDTESGGQVVRQFRAITNNRPVIGLRFLGSRSKDSSPETNSPQNKTRDSKLPTAEIPMDSNTLLTPHATALRTFHNLKACDGVHAFGDSIFVINADTLALFQVSIPSHISINQIQVDGRLLENIAFLKSEATPVEALALTVGNTKFQTVRIRWRQNLESEGNPKRASVKFPTAQFQSADSEQWLIIADGAVKLADDQQTLQQIEPKRFHAAMSNWKQSIGNVNKLDIEFLDASATTKTGQESGIFQIVDRDHTSIEFQLPTHPQASAGKSWIGTLLAVSMIILTTLKTSALITALQKHRGIVIAGVGILWYWLCVLPFIGVALVIIGMMVLLVRFANEVDSETEHSDLASSAP